MCGIFAYLGKQNAASLILKGLKILEYRGYDSWGIAVAKNGKIAVEKHTGKIPNDSPKVFSFKSLVLRSHIGLGHTRWATHGGVSKENAHPHLDCTKRIVIIHNGIVENFSEIKNTLLKKGHKFLSETDSEVITHLIEEENKKHPFEEAVRRAFLKLSGLNAVVALDAKTQIIIAAKTGSPLVLGIANSSIPNEFFLASDASALLPYTKNVYFLEDNDVVEIQKTVKIKELKSGKRKNITFQVLDWKTEDSSLGSFPHFMLKEIYEQPKIIENIAQNYAPERDVPTDTSQIQNLSQTIKKAYGTYLVGCGTAFYATLVGSYLFSKIANRHVNAAIGSEFGYLLNFLTKKSLIIALSQSGETIDIIESVTLAKQKGAKIIAVVNNLGSTLYRLADERILLGAGPEKAVASTKAFTAKLAILLLLAYATKGELNKGRTTLANAVKATKQILSESMINKIIQISKIIAPKEHIFIIGRGLSHPIALESALKIKEISYIHAEGFPAGELKHGVIALIEKGTPCIVIAPNDETYAAVISGAMELKARGGHIIGISFKKNEVFDDFIEVKDCQEATCIPNTVVAQLLAYYLAKERGCDIDKPRNLAKSVTVK